MKYNVYLPIAGSIRITVEAKDPEEAVGAALDAGLMGQGEVDDLYVDESALDETVIEPAED